MKASTHDRARELIAASPIEGVSPSDATWLQDHLATCAECAKYADASTLSRRVLHSVSLRVSPLLVAATQARVRVRAEELRRRDQRLIPVLISCALVFAIGFITTPLLWQAFAWIGSAVNLPTILWQAGFMVTWFAPALLAIVLVVALRDRRSESAAE